MKINNPINNKIMKEKDFKANYAYCGAIFTAYEVQLSRDGSMARAAYVYDYGHGETRHIYRWQEIKRTRSGRAYITCRGRVLYLDTFTTQLA